MTNKERAISFLRLASSGNVREAYETYVFVNELGLSVEKSEPACLHQSESGGLRADLSLLMPQGDRE